MNGYMPGGNVLGAAVSVLPATAAYSFLPSMLTQNLAASVASIALLWAVSYIAVTTLMRFFKG